jgi:hypothetical protein
MNLLQNGSIFTSQRPITQNTTQSTRQIDLEVGESEEGRIWPTWYFSLIF